MEKMNYFWQLNGNLVSKNMDPPSPNPYPLLAS